jgi:hypothetical protein
MQKKLSLWSSNYLAQRAVFEATLNLDNARLSGFPGGPRYFKGFSLLLIW